MKKALVLLAALAALAPFGAAQAQSATYALDPTHTFVTFEAKHLGLSTIRGRFDKKAGSVTIDPAAKTGKLEVSIDTTSISTGVGPFDGHLKSKDFFNVEQFPEAKFVGDKFEFDGTKVKSISGQLTMLGKTAPVTLVAESYTCIEHPRLKREACGGDFTATINRSQWGMTYAMPVVTPDAIKLLIQVEAIKQ